MRYHLRRAVPLTRAFTLVEVLVVLAIMVLLAALLFPTFSSVRRNSRTIACSNNLHQIGIAMRMYLDDYRNLYPSLSAHPDNCSWSYNIAPYIKSDAVFSCPEDEFRSFQPGCPPTRVDGDLRYFFKGAYSFNVPTYTQNAQLRDIRIKSPSTMILVLDGDGDHIGVGQGTGPLSRDELLSMGALLRHNGSANALFADGHAKWLSLNTLTDRTHWTLSGRDSS